MKKIMILGLAAFFLPALFACQGKGRQPHEINWQDGEVMAVAFLGYYDSIGDFEASPSYVRLSQAFPQIVGATPVSTPLGREIYLLVPRDPDATLAVNEAGEYITDDNRRVYYRSERGNPVLLFCNWSETDTQVNCTDNSGHSIQYYPSIDGQTGALKTLADGTVRDISLPIPAPMDGYTAGSYGADAEGGDLGFRIRLQAGRPVLTIAPDHLDVFGIDPDEVILPFGDNEFRGINGLCKGVFMGEIGQDYNPIVFVVMEDGGVKMCSLFYSLRRGEPQFSALLPGLKDVTGFEVGSGGGWDDDESGQSFFEYGTTYALDARGERTEMTCFLDSGTYRAEDARYYYEVELSPDWNYRLYCIDKVDYSPHETYFGSFRTIGWNGPECKFEFHRRQRMENTGEDFSYDYKPVSGSFSAEILDEGYKVDLSGSDVFAPGTMFSQGMVMDAAG